MDHDRARPGANVLHVALERLLRQEVHKARRQHGITVLMDMSAFYDAIQLDKLQAEALKLDYPPLLLELAMQLYCGRAERILAHDEEPLWSAGWIHLSHKSTARSNTVPRTWYMA